MKEKKRSKNFDSFLFIADIFFSWRFSLEKSNHRHELFWTCQLYRKNHDGHGFSDIPDMSKIVLPKVLQFWQSPFWLSAYYIQAVKEDQWTITQPMPDLTQTEYNEYRI